MEHFRRWRLHGYEIFQRLELVDSALFRVHADRDQSYGAVSFWNFNTERHLRH